MKKRAKLDFEPILINPLLEDLRGKTAEQSPPRPASERLRPPCKHPRLIPGLDADYCPDCRRSIPNWD